ncbi:chemotaxis protein CheW [Rhodoferax lacus]|uniref:Chemotaxis protein CheW n=1 Tax=Rhodoferax lacus TaxID=2184758 RepID=A0A3E1R9E6_9BURK|nr:chemotaxis protein CheW [Rhodoferax lacus]RFO95300.1 chemotaxis protein CheW [Rhodoferax lacus]
MAKREALRELQARLAKRLQAAQSEGIAVSWLAVRAGGSNYLLPLAQAGEIVALSQLQAVPYSKSWFRGVLNVRGNLVGVVDMARFVSGSASAPDGTEASVVTLNAQLEVNCGLQVDSLAGLRGSDAFASSTAAPAGAPEYFGPCHTDKEGQLWQEINLRALAQSPTFLSIGA